MSGKHVNIISLLYTVHMYVLYVSFVSNEVANKISENKAKVKVIIHLTLCCAMERGTFLVLDECTKEVPRGAFVLLEGQSIQYLQTLHLKY